MGVSQSSKKSVVLLWLGESATIDPARVGRKAGTLSMLSSIFSVPPGFCVPVETYLEARQRDYRCSTQLQRAIEQAYTRLSVDQDDAEPAVAVRSSALDEDGDVTSFAGQYSTYLGVRGADAVCAAIEHCWRASERHGVHVYRRERLGKEGESPLAVLVQRLVKSDVAAIAMTANPLTGATDEIIIDGNWGLGESIAGGGETPDTYIVQKADMSVIFHRIAHKRRILISLPNGVQSVCVPRIMAGRPVLSATEAVMIARLALDVEYRMGRPMEIECALQGNTVYLLQCRPMTGKKNP